MARALAAPAGVRRVPRALRPRRPRGTAAPRRPRGAGDAVGGGIRAHRLVRARRGGGREGPGARRRPRLAPRPWPLGGRGGGRRGRGGDRAPALPPRRALLGRSHPRRRGGGGRARARRLRRRHRRGARAAARARRRPAAQPARPHRAMRTGLYLLAGMSLWAGTAGARLRTYAIVVAQNRSLDPGVPPLQYADDDGVKTWELFS